MMFPKDDKPEYSIGMINNVMQIKYGKDTLSCYALNDLMSIYCTIAKSLVKIRSGCTVSEIITFLQIIFLTICGELGSNTSIGNILGHKRMLVEEV